MSCSCRASPWRIFLRGLAQVHQLDAVPISSNSVLRARLPISSSLALSGQRLAMPRPGRSLHTSSYQRQQDAAAAVPVEPREQGSESQEASSADDLGRTRLAAAKEETPGKKTRVKGRKPDAPREDAEWSSWKSEPAVDQSRPSRPRKPRLPRANFTEAAAPEPASQFKPQKEHWQLQKASMKEKFPEGWKPRKRLSPDALAGIRALNAQFPDVYTTQALADKFEVSSEAIRRILKSKWQPSVNEEEGRQDRWFRRGQHVWEQRAALGVKPPRRWREEGIARDPGYHAWSKKASQREQKWEEEEVRKYKAQRAELQKGTTTPPTTTTGTTAGKGA